MKMIVSLLSASALLIAGSTFAAQEQGGDAIAQCKQEAKKSGVKEADVATFLDNCINDKVGYERTKPGEAEAGGGGGE